MSEKMNKRIVVEIGDTQTEILMSFGRLDALSKLVGSPERIPEFDFNPEVRRQALALCLAPRSPSGLQLGAWEIPEELDFVEAEKILDWVQENVLGFFIRRLQRNLELMNKNKGTLLETASLLNSTAS